MEGTIDADLWGYPGFNNSGFAHHNGHESSTGGQAGCQHSAVELGKDNTGFDVASNQLDWERV